MNIFILFINRFGQFYSNFKGFDNEKEENLFQLQIYKGVRIGNYRQYTFK